DRIVALKIPHASLLSSAVDLERFHREAQAAAQLRHPGIVSVHDMQTLDGLPTLVEEFVTGVSLRDLLETRRMSFSESAGLVVSVADALEYAHQKGLVHRDVKPGNIMLEHQQATRVEGDSTQEPSGIGRPLLMDFGLALRDEV